MAGPLTWTIKTGVLAFKVVDTAAVGYLPTWNAPAGKTSTTAALTDYETDSTFWSCQITSGVLTPTADSTTTTRASTFCELGREIPTPLQSRWALDVEMFQDPHAGPTSPVKGLAQYTYENDAKEVYFMLGLNGSTLPPRAVGRIVMSPEAFGGVAQTELLATVSWPTTQKPDIKWGIVAVVLDEASVESELANA